MWKTLSLLQKQLVWAIPAMMLSGVIAGSLADLSFLKVTILPITFLMVYPMMVNLQFDRLFSLTDLRSQLFAQAINFGVIPFIAFGLGNYFFPDSPAAVLGLLLVALLPTSGMTISWTGFAKGNMGAAIKMTALGLIVGSLATPLYVEWLMGEVIEVPARTISLTIAAVILLPMLLGYLTRRSLIRRVGKQAYQARFKQKFPLLSTLGVLAMVFVAMSLKARSITGNPAILIEYLIPLAVFYLINFLLSTLAGRLWFKRGDAIAIVYGTVMRNLSIALAIAMTAFADHGSDIAIIVALAFIIQVQAAAWYVRLTDRLFGKAAEPVIKPAAEARS